MQIQPARKPMPMETKSYWPRDLCVLPGDSQPIRPPGHYIRLRSARARIELSTARKILAMFGFRRFLSLWPHIAKCLQRYSRTLGHDMRRFPTIFVCVVSAYCRRYSGLGLVAYTFADPCCDGRRTATVSRSRPRKPAHPACRAESNGQLRLGPSSPFSRPRHSMAATS